MNPLNARLPRHPEIDGPVPPAVGSAGWLKPLLWLCLLGVVVGTTLRRPLRGSWDATDLGFALLYATLAGALLVPYRLWQLHAQAQARDFLAQIRGDTLFVFAGPDSEQRVPLLGVTRVVQGATDRGLTEIVTERDGAMLEARFSLHLDPAATARLVEFVNESLRPGP